MKTEIIPVYAQLSISGKVHLVSMKTLHFIRQGQIIHTVSRRQLKTAVKPLQVRVKFDTYFNYTAELVHQIA